MRSRKSQDFRFSVLEAGLLPTLFDSVEENLALTFEKAALAQRLADATLTRKEVVDTKELGTLCDLAGTEMRARLRDTDGELVEFDLVGYGEKITAEAEDVVVARSLLGQVATSLPLEPQDVSKTHLAA